jgi:hypothetical protein
MTLPPFAMTTAAAGEIIVNVQEGRARGREAAPMPLEASNIRKFDFNSRHPENR